MLTKVCNTDPLLLKHIQAMFVVHIREHQLDVWLLISWACLCRRCSADDIKSEYSRLCLLDVALASCKAGKAEPLRTSHTDEGDVSRRQPCPGKQQRCYLHICRKELP